MTNITAYIKWTRKHNKLVRIIRKLNGFYIVQPFYHRGGDKPGYWGDEITVHSSRIVPGTVKKEVEND